MTLGATLKRGTLGAILALCCNGLTAAERDVQRVDLVAIFDDATLKAPDKGYVRGGTFDVAGDRRAGIFMHPSASAEFPPVEIGKDGEFVAGIAILPEAWELAGDGVEFRVTLVTESGESKTLLSRYLNPKRNRNERQWVELRIQLWPFAGKHVRLTLSTLPGPSGNNSADWAVWGAPAIVDAKR